MNVMNDVPVKIAANQQMGIITEKDLHLNQKMLGAKCFKTEGARWSFVNMMALTNVSEIEGWICGKKYLHKDIQWW